ncbi:hypothetical protein SEA_VALENTINIPUFF_22 [Microbacterium phage ValentiniPuff]|uniref:ASCH domain-containing protein n=1 Tax=Microbacterium phage ValentiniPuff TaxID=2315705 RepID=A0A386KP04_9CAUD|nr:hypothetical protein SEA_VALENTINIPUFF_22 [Microbacterium phage ValentiniPuff]
MKVISIKDPWATLIARGVKDVENRTWQTTYRGPLAIATSMQYDRNAHRDPVAAAAMVDDDRVRRLRPTDMHPGHIIAVVDLTDVHRHYSAGNGCDAPSKTFIARSCSLWGQPNVVHFRLENPRLLATPFPHRGSLGIRDLPAATIHQIQEQL